MQVRVDVSLILPEYAQHNFTALLVNSLLSKNTKAVHDVRCQSERNNLRDFKLSSLLKDAVEINMCDFSCVLVDQDIVAMSVSKSNYITNH
jgi:hypothetical protein